MDDVWGELASEDQNQSAAHVRKHSVAARALLNNKPVAPALSSASPLTPTPTPPPQVPTKFGASLRLKLKMNVLRISFP